MATFTFYPTHPEAKTSAIRIHIRWNNLLVRFSPGISVNLDYWDQNNQCLKNNKQYGEGAALNLKLMKVRARVKKTFEDLEEDLNRPPSRIELETTLKEKFQEPAAKTGGFLSYWQNRINRLVAELQADGKRANRNSTASSYQQTLAVMTRMLGTDLAKMGFDQIDEAFYTRLLGFCTRVLNHSPNNIGKHIKNVKAIMASAEFDGLHSNRAYKKFKMPAEEVHNIYLNREEIDRIYNLDLSGKWAHLAVSRDLFVIACSTGLRFGDWSQLSDLDLEGDTVRIIPEKTKNPVVIPLSKRVREILARYPKIPKSKENQPLNRDLKEIARLAEIKDPVKFQTTQGGKSTQVACEKWEMVSTHTARRSFATNLYLQGAPVVEIMKITGHKTETQFLKYIKITKDDAAKKLSAFID
ncbi:MAG: tyrosine-type recombinase/integrase [Bacteroidetes bacterium]|nr:tyrosine-type recombinase/integrase [Bacteroidota bacterium]